MGLTVTWPGCHADDDKIDMNLFKIRLFYKHEDEFNSISLNALWMTCSSMLLNQDSLLSATA